MVTNHNLICPLTASWHLLDIDSPADCKQGAAESHSAKGLSQADERSFHAIPSQLKIHCPSKLPKLQLKSAVYFSMKILHSLLTESKISLVITRINSLPSKKTMKISKSITPIA